MANPLFRIAGATMQRAALSAFQQTNLGRLVGSFQTLSSARPIGNLLTEGLRRYSGGAGAAEVLREMRGTGFGQFASEIMQFSAKSEMADVLKQFLGEMGPAGKIIQALAATGKRNNIGLDVLADLIHALGGEVLLPKSLRGVFKELDDRGLAAAIQRVQEEKGFTVIGPGEKVPRGKGKRPDQTPQSEQRRKGWEIQPKGGERLQPGAEAESNGYPALHPINTGEMVPAPSSSNVHSYGFDKAESTLYIRFLGPYSRTTHRREGEGSLYAYYHVPAGVFLGMMAAQSKGKFIWDDIRVRGTVAGHRYAYALVAIVGGYVPRKAVSWKDDKGMYRDALLKRRERGESGRWYESALPSVGDAIRGGEVPAHLRNFAARPTDPMAF